MALQNYVCPKCHKITEELFFQDEEVPKVLPCEYCGTPAEFHFPMIADTKTCWGDSHAYFDRGLGCIVKGSKHRDKICKERNLIPVDSFDDKHWLEDKFEEDANHQRAQHDFFTKYDEAVVRHNGDRNEAMEEVMPIEDCVAGKFDDLFRKGGN